MDSLIQRLQEGSGNDPVLSVDVDSAVRGYRECNLLAPFAGPGLCLALVREKLPGWSIDLQFGDDHWYVNLCLHGRKLYASSKHPDCSRAILIALLRALETTQGASIAREEVPEPTEEQG